MSWINDRKTYVGLAVCAALWLLASLGVITGEQFEQMSTIAVPGTLAAMVHKANKILSALRESKKE